MKRLRRKPKSKVIGIFYSSRNLNDFSLDGVFADNASFPYPGCGPTNRATTMV